jgi:hypothetical protein
MNASGTAGHGTELHRYVDLSSLGAFVVKSLAPFEWAGNAAPRLSPTAGGMLNAVGLQGPGIEFWIAHDLPKLRDVGANIVVSIWGFGVDDYAQAANLLRPVAEHLSAIEINLSCPNTKSATDGSARHAIFAHEPHLVEEIVRASLIDGVPAWAKLSPNTHLVIDKHCPRYVVELNYWFAVTWQRWRWTIWTFCSPHCCARDIRSGRQCSRHANCWRRWCDQWVGSNRTDACWGKCCASWHCIVRRASCNVTYSARNESLGKASRRE